MASGLLYGHQILLPSMLVLLPTFTPGSNYLLPAKKLISNTVLYWNCKWSANNFSLQQYMAGGDWGGGGGGGGGFFLEILVVGKYVQFRKHQFL